MNPVSRQTRRVLDDRDWVAECRPMDDFEALSREVEEAFGDKAALEPVLGVA